MFMVNQVCLFLHRKDCSWLIHKYIYIYDFFFLKSITTSIKRQHLCVKEDAVSELIESVICGEQELS